MGASAAENARRICATGASLDSLFFYLTDARFSTVAMVQPSYQALLAERTRYRPYGAAEHRFPSDLDDDGINGETADEDLFDDALGADIGDAEYNPDADLFRDGTIDTIDAALFAYWSSKPSVAPGRISDSLHSASALAPDNPIGYDGYVFNPESNLYTVRFRWYDAVIGRWLERDPLEYQDGMNNYLGMLSEPIMALDPFGLASCCCDDLKGMMKEARRLGRLLYGDDQLHYRVPLTDAQRCALEAKLQDLNAAMAYAEAALECTEGATYQEAMDSYTFGQRSDGMDQVYQALEDALREQYGPLAVVQLFGVRGAGCAEELIAKSSATASRSCKSGRLIVAKGKWGEAAAGIKAQKVKITIPGTTRTRIPDELTSEYLREVKNCKKLSYTRQLRDFVAYAQSQQPPLKVILAIRRGTENRLGGPLRKAIECGHIDLEILP